MSVYAPIYVQTKLFIVDSKLTHCKSTGFQQKFLAIKQKVKKGGRASDTHTELPVKTESATHQRTPERRRVGQGLPWRP